MRTITPEKEGVLGDCPENCGCGFRAGIGEKEFRQFAAFDLALQWSKGFPDQLNVDFGLPWRPRAKTLHGRQGLERESDGARALPVGRGPLLHFV
jgi:hypothetical protein